MSRPPVLDDDDVGPCWTSVLAPLVLLCVVAVAVVLSLASAVLNFDSASVHSDGADNGCNTR